MSVVNDTAQELRPLEFLRHQDRSSNTTGLIILNSPLIDEYEVVRTLWARAHFVICADGGANRVYELMSSRQRGWDQEKYPVIGYPDLIHGDLDSLRDDVRDYYTKKGVEISEDPDQYSTDFGKAIKTLIGRVHDLRDVVVLGSISGRVDQGLGLLHEFYREQHIRHPNLRFWLVSESSMTFILPKGKSTIHVPVSEGLITSNIGIVPIYAPAVITTKGFEWDVQDWPTQMGGQVSTSNHIFADQVEVTTDTEVLFTVERAA